MKRSVLIKVILGSLGFLCMASANAMWQVYATWQIGDASPTYTAVGSTKEEALLVARGVCSDAQRLKKYKVMCSLNEPTRTQYVEFPDGPYTISCDKCRIESGTLVCNLCKPKIERRELDLKACTPESVRNIENCNGDLTCGACPPKAPPTIPTGPTRSYRGVCDKEMKNCKAMP